MARMERESGRENTSQHPVSYLWDFTPGKLQDFPDVIFLNYLFIYLLNLFISGLF